MKEQIDTIAASVLTGHFAARYPGYPTFGEQITRLNMAETVEASVGPGRDRPPQRPRRQGAGGFEPHRHAGEPRRHRPLRRARCSSGWMSGGGRAVNRSELFVERDPDVPSWGPWHLEPAFFVVVAAALCQLGKLEIGFSDGQIDALGLERLTRMSLDELEAVTHVVPPKELPLVILKDALKLLGLPPGGVGAQGATEALVQSVATRCNELADRIVKARAALTDGVSIWGAQIVEHQAERAVALKALEDAVNNLKARNTVGKLNKVDLTKEQLGKAANGGKVLEWIEGTLAAAGHISDVVGYLREAVDVFGPDDPSSVDANSLRAEVLELFRSDAPTDPAKVAALKANAEDLRRRFAAAAVAAHERDRLGIGGDERKRSILEGPTYADLRKLSAIDLLPGGKYASLQQKLAELGTCKAFDPNQLTRTLTCPECNYRPRPSRRPERSGAVGTARRADHYLALRVGEGTRGLTLRA